MKHPKPIKAFCAVTPEGKLIAESCASTRQRSKLFYMDSVPEVVTWPKLYKQGFRCVRVTIIP